MAITLETTFFTLFPISAGAICIILILHGRRIVKYGGKIKFTGWLIGDIGRASDEIANEQFQKERRNYYEWPCISLFIITILLLITAALLHQYS